jgi:hypothetical protein
LFVSATLLFLIQPMIAKMVLPLLGGTPAVWNTCMVFFQAALLAGYAYAHGITAHVRVRRQVIVHMLLICLPIVVLPIGIAKWTPPSDANPIPWLLAILGLSVGLPFFVLSTSAPLLQKWFANTGHPAGKDPYFLYAASNLGSMLALLSYPAFVEPYLPLKSYTQLAADVRANVWLSQSWLWAAGYGLFVLFMVACAQAVWKAVSRANSSRLREALDSDYESEGERPSILRRLHWVALAFVPSSLMLGVTTHITLDIAAIPLLWVIPLALYLLSFILVFWRWPAVVHKAMALIMPLFVLLLVFVMNTELTAKLSVVVRIALHLAVLFLVAIVCHGELAHSRPSTRYLTQFFLLMSVGGVLGGLFNALVAPLVFTGPLTGVYEYPIAITCACLLVPPLNPGKPVWLSRWFPERWSRFVGITADVLFAAVAGLLMLGLIEFAQSDFTATITNAAENRGRLLEGIAGLVGTVHDRLFDGILRLTNWFNGLESPRLQRFQPVRAHQIIMVIEYGLPALLCYIYVSRPLRFGLAVGALFLASYFFDIHSDNARVLYQTRSFFGVMKVKYDLLEDDDGSRKYPEYTLVHGTTIHGKQIRTPDLETAPATYYHHTGPIGYLFDSFQHTGARKNVAVIGLGSGTMSSYGQPGMRMTFYDIDPAVIGIATNPDYFTYYTRSRADKRIILGDARLQITKAEDHEYDLIVVDAFSSDAIPIHLITREAIQLYLQKLSDNGVLAVHISNRYLDLEPVLGNIVKDLDVPALYEYDSEQREIGKTASEWVIIAKNWQAFGDLVDDERWSAPKEKPAVGVWTDDFSNLLRVFQWKN